MQVVYTSELNCEICFMCLRRLGREVWGVGGIYAGIALSDDDYMVLEGLISYED